MGRAPCCDKNGLKKGPWTPEEDQKLLDYIQKHGHGRWRTLPKNAGLSRCGKSCRLRWTNYLRPDIKRGKFSFQEEETIIQLHSILGNKWSAIASRLPGRTDNEIKNFWNTHIRKRLLRMGIDPVTHSPRLDLLDLSSLLSPSFYSNPSHLEISRLLGVEPALNTELLRIATGLLSAQRQNTQLLRQNNLLEQQQQQQQQQQQHHQQQQQQQFPNTTVQEQFQPSFSAQQLTNPFQQIPVCTTSVAALMDGAQLMQANTGELYAADILPCSLPENFSIPQDSEFFGDAQVMDTFGLVSSEAPDFGRSSCEAFNFPSVLSTPASSPTPMNSSSTYINSTATTATEDERDSYCSSVLNFQMPDLLDVSCFM